MATDRHTYTGGEWTTEAVSDAVRIIVYAKSNDGQTRKLGGKKIVLARLNPPQLHEGETHANARLMAHAPKLLRALREISTRGTHGEGEFPMTPSELREIARDAIAELEGTYQR